MTDSSLRCCGGGLTHPQAGVEGLPRRVKTAHLRVAFAFAHRLLG